MAKAKHDHYVYSNMAASVIYAAAVPVEGRDLPESVEGILIRGGVGVADKKTLVTPTGAVVTGISSEELARLRADRVFLEHEKNGAVRVANHEADPEVVAADLRERDESAQLTPEDYETPPVVGAETAAAADPAPRRNPRRA